MSIASDSRKKGEKMQHDVLPLSRVLDTKLIFSGGGGESAPFCSLHVVIFLSCGIQILMKGESKMPQSA